MMEFLNLLNLITHSFIEQYLIFLTTSIDIFQQLHPVSSPQLNQLHAKRYIESGITFLVTVVRNTNYH